jgi:hypothetical protein
MVRLRGENIRIYKLLKVPHLIEPIAVSVQTRFPVIVASSPTHNGIEEFGAELTAMNS